MLPAYVRFPIYVLSSFCFFVFIYLFFHIGILKSESTMSFDKDFLFGVSTSAYQVEGSWNENGKGENIWDRFTHTGKKITDTGDISCDSYHLYKEDVALMKDIGFNVYRFSVSWSRILPEGEITRINEDGVNYYHALINELLKNGIEPMITIYHWDLPQRLQDMGGWMNSLIVEFIEDYADLLFKLYGDKVKWWITINEPLQITWGYETKRFAPALNLGLSASYIVGHNVLKAHGRIFRLYDVKYRTSQNGKLSIGINVRGLLPKTDSVEDREAAERLMAFEVGWFAHPVYSKEGDYPPIMRKIIDANSTKEGRNRSRLPTFTKDEIDAIRGSYDFFALNHYTSLLTSFGPPLVVSAIKEDIGVQLSADPKWPVSALRWLKVVPQGMRETLRWVKEAYENPPVFITENGYCDDSATLNDTDRISYHKEYLMAINEAIHKHSYRVIGYMVWSLLDNYEWAEGYKKAFGIVQVDFNDPKRKRTPKLSATFFKQLLATHTIPDKQYN